MKSKIEEHFQTVLHHLYINPLEKCNLKCKICYTRKTDPILSKEQILEFIEKYQNVHELQTITFCGGEVFALAYFPSLVNELVQKGIFVQIITNGTIDKLDQFVNPNFVNLIVSLDGLNEYHDANRGKGNFEKSIGFMKKGKKLGFHLEVFSIVTKQNLALIDAFETYLFSLFGKIPVTYHPRKPPEYLLHHPVSNIVGEINGFDFLSPEEMFQVMKERNVFPPKDLGCYQIALVSDGKVYGCCEGVKAIGTINDSIETLTKNLKKRIIEWESSNTLKGCLGCSQSEFMCGIKQYLEVLQKNGQSTTSLYS
jgi:radical SAM protein with 4Fe4S-binding SPASM domain